MKFPYKLVTFDINGTLLKPKGSIGQIYAEFGKRHGLFADPGILDDAFRAAYKQTNRAHPNFGLASGLGWRRWWIQVVTRTFLSSLSGSLKEDETGPIQVVADDLVKYFSSGESWELKKGSLTVLKKLKSFQTHLGVISNSDPRLHAILKDKNLHQYFTFVLTSYEASLPKPRLEIFYQACDLYLKITGQAIKGQDVLHIGNDIDLDYRAARDASWDSILVGGKPTLKGQDIDQQFVFIDLVDLNQYLDKFESR